MTTQGLYLDAREVTELEQLREACGEHVRTAEEWRACFLLSSRAEQRATAQGVIDTYAYALALEEEANRQRADAVAARGRADHLEAELLETRAALSTARAMTRSTP